MSRCRFLLSLLLASVGWIAPLNSAQDPVAPPKPPVTSDADPDALPAGAWARLGSARFSFGDYVSSAALSPNGKLLALTSNQRMSVALIELATGKEINKLQGQVNDGTLQNIAFSADGKVLAGQSFQSLRLWDVDSGKLIQQITHRDPNGPGSFSISLSGDGKFLALGNQGFNQNAKAFVYVWEVATGKLHKSFEVVQNYQLRGALSFDGKLLVTWGMYQSRAGENNPEAGRTLQIWDVASGKELRKVTVDHYGIRGAAFAPDGKTLAFGSGQALYHLVDVASGNELRRFAGRRSLTGLPGLVQFSPDGATLAAGDGDGGVIAWNAANGKRLELADGPKGRVMSFAFPAKNQILVLGVHGQTLYWWDAVTGNVLSSVKGHQQSVQYAGFLRNGRQLVSASHDGKLIWWDAATGKEVRQQSLRDEDAWRYYGGPGNLRYQSFAMSPDGKYLATSGDYGGTAVRVWDLARQRVVCDCEASRNYGQAALAFSPDGARLAISSYDRSLAVWDLATGQEIARLCKADLNPGGGDLGKLAFSPDGQLLAVNRSYYDRKVNQQAGEIVLYDIAAGKERARINRAGYGPSLLAFAADGKFFVVHEANSLVFLQAANGKEFRRIPMSMSPSTLTLSPDGRVLATAHTVSTFSPPNSSRIEVTLELWEIATGQSRGKFSGHSHAIQCLAFSPDGATLASGSSDTSLLLWDIQGRKQTSLPASTAPAEFDAAWADLLQTNAKNADEAVRKLARVPAASVAYLRTKLQPAQRLTVDEGRIATLVASLDNEKFVVRDKAYRELEKIGADAEGTLRKTLTREVSLEMRRRAEELLAKMQRVALTPEELRAARAIEALERIASPDVTVFLTELASGAPAASLTQEAHGALRRLAAIRQ